VFSTPSQISKFSLFLPPSTWDCDGVCREEDMTMTASLFVLLSIQCLVGRGFAFLVSLGPQAKSAPRLSMSSSATETTTVPSWADLTDKVATTAVGRALNAEVKLRKEGKGSAHVQNTLRLFASDDEEPRITLYRDHAG
jgi:hypothetical protein